ncbi:MAG: Gfo/Idh/MocA family oxidoreductase [Clostridia bacterium]|nr:Gfo/Idh/MocA family oxidoreductase [Clostridia bacterium]
MLRVAMLSKWHVHAAGYAREFLSSGKAEINAVWDEKADRGEEWAKELGCDFEPDLDKLLARDDIDAVCCCAPTTMHKDVIIRAAKAGKHIFTEKTLACTVAECMEIAKEIEKNNVTFVISFPDKAWPIVKFAKQHIENGDFGRVTNIRIRNAHNGVSGNWLPEYWFIKEDCAGGAMMDLGCHAMYLLSHLLGKPKKITGIANSVLGTPVDENAISVIEFENGAIGVSETSFLAFSSPFTIEIHGTDGILLWQNGEIKYKTTETAKLNKGFITPDNLPKENEKPIPRFIDACINGTGSPEGLGMQDAIELAVLLENSYISYETGKTVEIKE